MLLQKIGPELFAVDLAYCLSEKGKKIWARVSEGMTDRILRNNANKEDRTHVDSGAWFDACFVRINGDVYGARGEFNPLNYTNPKGEYGVAKRMVEAQRTGEFYLTPDIMKGTKQFTKILQEIEETDHILPIPRRRVMNFGRVVSKTLPTEALKEQPEIIWLSEGVRMDNGDTLEKAYFDCLLKEDLGIRNVTFYHIPKNQDNALRNLWFQGLGGNFASSLLCYGKDAGLNEEYGSIFVVP